MSKYRDINSLFNDLTDVLMSFSEANNGIVFQRLFVLEIRLA
jgi:hypothetical protein